MEKKKVALASLELTPEEARTVQQVIDSLGWISDFNYPAVKNLKRKVDSYLQSLGGE